jgi:hypothetical protein
MRKPIEKSETSVSELELEKKCILKLYSLLKEKGYDRDQARETSISQVRDLQS